MDHLAAQYYIVKEVNELNEFNERTICAEGRSPDRGCEGIRATWRCFPPKYRPTQARVVLLIARVRHTKTRTKGMCADVRDVRYV